jgi:hypothetical protein
LEETLDEFGFLLGLHSKGAFLAELRKEESAERGRVWFANVFLPDYERLLSNVEKGQFTTVCEGGSMTLIPLP